MDIGRIVTWAVVAAIGYGGYQYLSTGDVSIMPPTQQTVLELVNQSKTKNKPNEKLHYAAGQACTRVGGGYIKGGVYSCEYKIYQEQTTYGTPQAVETILVEKKNGQWEIKK
ncbi:hypothetical protein L1281_002433 [Neisseria sp. HSC-16F19]|nr:hypothetical protein [Neisseria sp. HSC-16F19]MCP2041816.1 hypothetical protein [Neisseria sp. HSC-16F19]